MLQVRIVLPAITDLLPHITVQFDIVKLFHLRRSLMSLHSSINRVHKTSVMDELEEEVPELCEFREGKLHNSMVILLKKGYGFLDGVDNARRDLHLWVGVNIPNS